jgi:hypothetical protein
MYEILVKIMYAIKNCFLSTLKEVANDFLKGYKMHARYICLMFLLANIYVHHM